MKWPFRKFSVFRKKLSDPIDIKLRYTQPINEEEFLKKSTESLDNKFSEAIDFLKTTEHNN
jgi:hypothetical protein